MTVNTVSLSVTGNDGTFLGWLFAPVIDIVVGPLVQQILSSQIQNQLQGTLNAKLAAALAAQPPPKGTTFTIAGININPMTGISIQAWASIPMTFCVGSASGGSVKFRSVDKVKHLRLIRNRLLARSPEGAGYIALLKKCNPTIMKVLMRNQDLLKLGDTLVDEVLRDFPLPTPEHGTVSSKTAATLVHLLDRLADSSPNELALVIRAVKASVPKFNGKPAKEVLDQSWSLVEDSQ